MNCVPRLDSFTSGRFLRPLKPSKAKSSSMAATLTVASSVAVSPVGAVARTAIVRVDGAGRPAAEKVTDWPGVSNVPLSSRSQR